MMLNLFGITSSFDFLKQANSFSGEPYMILLPLGLILLLSKIFSLLLGKIKIPEVVGFLIGGLLVGCIYLIPGQPILTDYTMSNHAARRNDRTISNMNSTRDHDIACNPNVVSDNDRFCILTVRQYIRLIMISISLLITEGVDWGHEWAIQHQRIRQISGFDLSHRQLGGRSRL